MKKVFKFFPAALAVVALASCSSDDLFEKSSVEVSSEYTLNVSTESDDAATRAGHVIIGSSRSVVWQAGDVIRTYDNNLGNFDEYAVPKGADASKSATFGYKGTGEPELASHNYAVFPGDYVNTLGWGKVADVKVPILTMDIPETGISFNENFGKIYTEDDEDYTIGASYVPMWGDVKDATATNPDVTMFYLTAFLQVDLSAIPAAAQKLIVYAPNKEPLSGRFEAALDDPTDTYLEADEDKYQYSNKIVVDIEGANVAGKNGSIYLPIIAEQYYKNLVVAAVVGDKGQILACYGPNVTTSAEDKTALSITDDNITSTTPDKWKDGNTGKYIAKLGGKLFADGFMLPRKQAVVIEKTFELPATCAYPSDITNALATYSQAKNLTLDIDNTSAIQCSAANYQVTIPSALKDADITLNIKNGVAFVATGSDMKFSGQCNSLTVKVQSISQTADGFGFDFSAVNGDVEFAGLSSITVKKLVAQNTEDLSFTYGKNVTNTSALTANKADIVVAEGATLGVGIGATGDGNDIVGDVVIAGTMSDDCHIYSKGNVVVMPTGVAKNITAAGTVTVNGTPATESAAAVKGTAAVISAKGNVEVYGSAGNITVVDGANVTFAPVAAEDYTGTITVTDGTVTLDNKGKAVATVVKSKAGDIELKNGKLSTLTLTNVPAGQTVNVKSYGLSEITATGYTAPTAAATVNFTSTWDYVPTAAELTAVTASSNIYTATQLAKATFGEAATLKTNITIASGKAWAKPTLNKNFTATGYTISGLNAPLFSTIDASSGAIEITGVTIQNAAIANWEGEAGVGLLAGATSGTNAITITKSSVAGSIASKDATHALYYAGGVIGKHAGTGKLTFGDNTDANKVTAAVTFTNNGRLFGESGVDVKAGTIGQILGSNTATGEVEISQHCAATGAFDKSNTALKFQNLRKYNASYEIEGYFKGNSNLIGYCSGVANVKIGTVTYLATAAYTAAAGLTYSSKTVSGTLHFLNADTKTAQQVKAAIKTGLSIDNADYEQKADGTDKTNNVTWNQQVEVLNSYVAETY